MKSVFFCDIPLGGGTSGSSAKVITDVLTFTSASGVFRDPGFRLLIRENGRKAGLFFERGDADPFSFALSMYLAHYENGLDFGDLRRNRGVGTFGGSEDHTAIILGERDRMLFCRDFNRELPADREGDAALAELGDSTTIAGRAYQCFREMEIVGRWVEALEAGDRPELARLLNLSNDLSRDDLGNIAPEIDALQKSAAGLGTFGASGFGGCCYALVPEDECEEFPRR